MDNITLIGTVAATCTTMAFVPQVIKAHRTRHVRDLSMSMFIIFSFGVASWFVYGILTESAPIIIANVVTFCMSVYILYLKIRYGREK